MKQLKNITLTLLILASMLPRALAAEEKIELTGPQQAKLIAAARLDLQSKLLREIKGMTVAENTTLANLVDVKSVIDMHSTGVIKGMQEERPVFRGDLCVINGSITLQNVIENIKSTVKERNGKLTELVEKIRTYNGASIVKGTGLASLPAPPTAREGANSADKDGMLETLDALKGPGAHKLQAIKIAELNAYARLAASIKGINISDEQVVLNAALSGWTEATTKAFLKGARVRKYFAMTDQLAGCEMEILLQNLVENVNNSTKELNGKVVTVENIKRFNDGLSVVKVIGYGPVGGDTIDDVRTLPRIGSVE